MSTTVQIWVLFLSTVQQVLDEPALFIAIDSLMAQINDNATHINIFECVSHLRHQRNHLVQSLKQYIFVYRAIMEFAEFGDTEIEICHLRDHYRLLKDHKFEGNVNGIMVEFEVLSIQVILKIVIN